MKNSANFVDTRRRKIIKLFEAYGRVKVSFLADELSTSPLTIRRDLDYLEKNRIIERFHGGAELVNPVSTSFSSTLVLHKHAIAKEAAKCVQDRDTIFMNTSSTALLVLKYITAENVTVITNNAKAIHAERNESTLIVLTGGELREPKESMVGHFAMQNLNRVSAAKVFLGCNGLSLEQGIATSVLQEASINEMMLKRAHQRIILADHSKIGVTESFTSGQMQEGDTLITDSDSPKNILERFKRMGVNVVVVSPVRSLA